jgi:glycosyltransferase involved in cell wall biosynthesis
MLNNVTKKTKLGIDAKWFFEGPPSGKMVVKNLVDEMLRNNADRFKIYLFMAGKYKKQAEAYFPADTKIVYLPAIPNLLSNLLLLPFIAWLFEIDIMLFQNFGSFGPRRLFKIVYIHDVLFLDYPEYYSKLELFYFRNMKRLATKANLIITISETEKQRLIKNHVNSEKGISVVYHGINHEFKPSVDYPDEQIRAVLKKYDLPANYLLFVGRVNIRKNLKNLLKSLTLLHDSRLKLVIVGEQEHAITELRAYIAANNLADRVIFTGLVPEDDLHLIYARATIFCFPSFAEGFGLPPLEAMHCGIPVVVSNRTAMPEVCGDAAVYINPDDADDIAKKINLLLDDTQLYNEKKRDGINHSNKFSWERSANQILDLISNTYAN